jgi:hypothetical protein
VRLITPPPPITCKEATPDGSFVTIDHTGRVLRRLDEIEAAELPFRSVVAPIRIQNAFAALHGAESWNSKYEELRYQLRSRDIPALAQATLDSQPALGSVLRDNPHVSRTWRLACLIITLLLLMATGVLAGNGVPVRSIRSAVPALRGAVALGTLVALDPKTDVAEFRIRCGWYARRGKPNEQLATVPQRKLRPGLWKVALRGFAFNVETYPNGPASGIANPISLHAWERRVARFGWTGSLWIASGWSSPVLSDGPTTDICRGVLG